MDDERVCHGVSPGLLQAPISFRLSARAKIDPYAQTNGLTIVHTYRDEGISGLRIKNRMGLRRLIEDVQSGCAEFGHLLVYDVSRWGRFQGPCWIIWIDSTGSTALRKKRGLRSGCADELRMQFRFGQLSGELATGYRNNRVGAVRRDDWHACLEAWRGRQLI
jgi:hypothetical protein